VNLGGPSIDKVIDGGYCVGCGACAASSASYEIYENRYGLYQARKLGNGNESGKEAICPFSSTLDETAIGTDLYGDDSKFDQRVGYYKSIYAGHVQEKTFRAMGSSGGMVTWVLNELFSKGKIQGVVHVGE